MRLWVGVGSLAHLFDCNHQQAIGGIPHSRHFDFWKKKAVTPHESEVVALCQHQSESAST